ncbi:hypothetical protein DPMN_149627 [Dreissena polymorpha]|uniref:Uncharacterized protein n=1 Tax=Dreissena polymorpha TaxID=45954 RepID=A0A9D4FG68_DREPO|nr:hypothetical protein DPMN_149627 [Dreissena polymorpha]
MVCVNSLYKKKYTRLGESMAMDHQRQNDLSAGTIGSVDYNPLVPTCETDFALTYGSWKTVRDYMEIVRRHIESTIYSSPHNTRHHSRKQRLENTDDIPISQESSYKKTKKETSVKEPYLESDKNDSSGTIYSRQVYSGDRSFFLICEPQNKPHDKVLYTQEGNRPIIINLIVSSIIYQLEHRVKPFRNMQIIRLDSKGEVWFEIKRRRDIEFNKKFGSPGTNESTFTDTTWLASSESDNIHHDTYESRYKWDVVQHSDLIDEYDSKKDAGSRSIEETSYVFETKDPDEWKGSQYQIISISEDADQLKMRFSRPSEEKLEDLERLILSHHRVLNFIRDSSNDLDASLCDWIYQSDESIYGHITSRPWIALGIEELEPEEDDDRIVVSCFQKDDPVDKIWKDKLMIHTPSHQRASSSASLTGPFLPPRIGTAAAVQNPAHGYGVTSTVQIVPPYVSIPCATPVVPPVPVPVLIPPSLEDSSLRKSSHHFRRDGIQDCERYHGKFGKEEAKEILEREPSDYEDGGLKNEGQERSMQFSPPIVRGAPLTISVELKQEEYVELRPQPQHEFRHYDDTGTCASQLAKLFETLGIDVKLECGLDIFPAFFNTCEAIQAIITEGKSVLDHNIFDQLDEKVIHAKDVIIYTATSLLKDITEAQPKMPEFEEYCFNKHTIRHPFVVIVKREIEGTLKKWIEDTHTNVKLMSVLLLDTAKDNTYIPPMRHIFLKYTTASNILTSIDDILERISFSVLNGFVERCMELYATIEKITDTEKETLLYIYASARNAYARSEVPKCERPSIPETIYQYPDNIDSVIANLLQISGVIGCSKSGGKIEVCIESKMDKDIRDKVQQIACENSILVKCVSCTLTKYFSAGDKIDVNTKIGTLGGFAHRYPNSQMTNTRNQRRLSAVISKHLADVCGHERLDLIVDGQIIGQTDLQDLEYLLDVLPIDVYQQYEKNCDTRFKTEKGKYMYGVLITDEIRQTLPSMPVFLWGAKSSPGLGTIEDIMEISDGIYIKIRDREECCSFAKPGDSGAFICGTDLRERTLYVIAVLMGKLEGSSSIRYVAVLMKEALDKLGNIYGSDFKLCVAES